MPDVIVNAAAYTDVERAEAEPELARMINARGAGAVAAAAAASGARVIQLSTDYVFDGTSALAYREDAATNPLNAYGRSKLEGERLVREAGADHLIVRTSWLYSPFGTNFVSTMLEAARKRDVLNVVDDQRGSPTSALELADALLMILERWAGGSSAGIGETFHLTGTGSASWFELAEHIFGVSAALGLPSAGVRPIKAESWPTKATRPPNSVLDSSKFDATYSYRMPHWRQSVADVVGAIGACCA